MRAAEEGVGGGADPQALLASHRHQLVPVCEIGGERLFGIGVLAGLERLHGDCHVRLRHGQVDDEFDRRVREEIGDVAGLDLELRSALFGETAVQISDPADVQDRKGCHRLQIGRRDVAAADDADTEFFHQSPPEMDR